MPFAQWMAEKCEFHPMTYATLFEALQRGEIDLAIGGITISPERESQFIFSLYRKLHRKHLLSWSQAFSLHFWRTMGRSGVVISTD
ncbi:transporter substrate-binding domain-containing protein [Legionella oakridgensis]|uniref:transporter substrate-binding domain-containing protein n=1 Tax=Legionella oakridgensis TaxID=29423 RepID=UPI0009DE5967|nr:transporter substrate-binding domain-containing protein [Legionella oakridgensis]